MPPVAVAIHPGCSADWTLSKSNGAASPPKRQRCLIYGRRVEMDGMQLDDPSDRRSIPARRAYGIPTG